MASTLQCAKLRDCPLYTRSRFSLQFRIILGEYKAENGALSGTCHKQPNLERVEVVTEAYSKTAYANPLNPDAFPGIRKMEAEVVRICCNLFHGDPDTSCGTVCNEQRENSNSACFLKISL